MGSAITHLRERQKRIAAHRKRIQDWELNSCVYLIGSLEKQLGKIGYSSNVEARLERIRNACPFEIEILGTTPGNKSLEKTLQHRFEVYRVRNGKGEWYKLNNIISNEFTSTDG